MISLYEFLVKDKSKIDKMKMVDLDLPSGTEWATCNIGAVKPEDYGLLFQWGRTDGYKYDDENNKFLSKEDYVTTSGTKYEKDDILKLEDDAAYQATKGKLRMPTKDEIDELLKYTNNDWTELNGVKGRKFVSKKDDSKWIFIPAAGGCDGDNSFYGGGSNSYVWSSSVKSNNASYAYNIHFTSDYCGHNDSYRYYKFSVRGVLNK